MPSRSRRAFLKVSMAAGAPAGLAAACPASAPLATTAAAEPQAAPVSAVQAPPPVSTPVPTDKRTLVVVQLSGGNDGLNAVVPYGNGLYYQLRPQIGIAADQVLHLNDQV